VTFDVFISVKTATTLRFDLGATGIRFAAPKLRTGLISSLAVLKPAQLAPQSSLDFYMP